MALIPKNKYPGQVDPSDTVNYPYGKAQNVTAPGDGTGTPWEEALVNDIFGFQQALLTKANITPDGNPDQAHASQYLEAIEKLVPDAVDAGYMAPKPRTIALPGLEMAPERLSEAARGSVVAVAGDGWNRMILDALTVARLTLNRLLPRGARLMRAELYLTVSDKSVSGELLLLQAKPSPDDGYQFVATAQTGTSPGNRWVTINLTSFGGFEVGELPLYLAYRPNSVTSGADVLRRVELTYFDPGPRNF